MCMAKLTALERFYFLVHHNLVSESLGTEDVIGALLLRCD